MHRFFFEEQDKLDDVIVISGDDVNHIRNVLRLGPKDRVTLCDGAGHDFLCELEKDNKKDSIAFRIIEETDSKAELPVKIVLYQGIPKKDKMDLIVQKTVELGVAKIVPVAMKRCVAKIEDARSEERKIARWQEIAKAAAKQSGRGRIPEIGKAIGYRAALDTAFAENNGFVIVPYENEDGMNSLKSVMEAIKEKTIGKECGTISVFIGPEGGFDESEAEEAKKQGAVTVSLGHRILRTETAGLATLSVLMYELETL